MGKTIPSAYLFVLNFLKFHKIRILSCVSQNIEIKLFL